MANEIRTIGVLTSGGDAPGMNAAIRAVVRRALAAGKQVKGIQRGYAGLLQEEIVDMNKRSVSDIIQRGGTILQTARCMEFTTPDHKVGQVNPPSCRHIVHTLDIASALNRLCKAQI